MATQLATQEAPSEALLGGDVLQNQEAVNEALADAVNERDYEGEARQQGWTDQEAFKGDPNRWVDAETFMKRSDEVMPLLKKQNAGLKREIDDLKRMVKRVVKSEQRAFENALTEIEARQDAAVESGDVAESRRLREEAKQLRADMTESPVQITEDPNKAFLDFRRANAWVDGGALASATPAEKGARILFFQLSDYYAGQGVDKTMEPSAFFDKVREEVGAEFPEAFTGAKTLRPKGQEAVAGVTRNGAARSAKTGANLPPEAKMTAERYMRNGIFKGCKTKEEAWNLMAKDYDWS